MNGSTGKVSLVVSREEARSLLNEAIERGLELSQKSAEVRDASTFSDWGSEQAEWRKFCEATFHRISNGNALVDEFEKIGRRGPIMVGGPPLSVGEKLEKQLSAHRRALKKLDSIVERLPLFEAPDIVDIAHGADVGANSPGSGVFIVHGRQRDPAELVARFVEQLGLHPIILDEQPNRGETVIEKFESHASSVGLAIVLMLADDKAQGPDDEEFPARPNRARQNVVFEFGYFVAKLGRPRVVAMLGDGVEQPSDIAGLVYVPYDDGWQMRLLREIKSALPNIDTNAAFGA